jgi:hypothetical protein
MSKEHPTMREDEEVELLSKVGLFDSLSEEEIRVLLRENSDIRLEEGETFYAPWETAFSEVRYSLATLKQQQKYAIWQMCRLLHAPMIPT